MRRYTQEKKDQIIKEVEDVKSISAVSRKYDIATTTIHGWIKKENKKIDFKINPKSKTDNKNIKKKTARYGQGAATYYQLIF